MAVLLAGLVGVQLPVAGAAEPAAEWAWPLDGSPAVTRPFAPPAVRYGTGHRGVDLGGAAGAPVRAARAGRVSYAGLLAGRGVVVVVHGDLRTTYEPVTAEVTVGQQVTAGQPLGTLAAGHAGCSVTACLHWGLRRGEHYLDPLSLVDPGPPRLLPLSDPPAAASLPAPLQGAPTPPEPPGALDVPPPSTVQVPDAVPPAAPAAAVDRDWALRSAQTPAGLGALVALLAGLALLAGRRRPAGPARLAHPGARLRAGRPGVLRPAGPEVLAPDERGRLPDPVAPDVRPTEPARVLVDLGVERSRRRPVA